MLVIGSIFFSTFNLNHEDNYITNDHDLKIDDLLNPDSNISPQPKGEKIAVYNINNEHMFSLDEFYSIYNMEWQYDYFEGTIELKDTYHTYYFLKGTSVIAEDGIYLPYESKMYTDKDNNVFINLDILEDVFNYDYNSIEGEEAIEVFALDDSSVTENKSYLKFENQFPNMTEEDMIEYLSFLSVPLQGAHITSRDSQMPGAPRDYRNGTHEGIDWYAGTTGINIDKDTPILSMADGIVVRADYDYVELSNAERDEILGIAANSDHTPQYILDKLRGRTVWIQYDNGVMVRYAHLSRIAENIKVGAIVNSGDTIGYVGNSGTSYGVEENDVGLHLHSDILIYNNLFWEHFDNNQIRLILETLFPE